MAVRRVSLPLPAPQHSMKNVPLEYKGLIIGSVFKLLDCNILTEGWGAQRKCWFRRIVTVANSLETTYYACSIVHCPMCIKCTGLVRSCSYCTYVARHFTRELHYRLVSSVERFHCRSLGYPNIANICVHCYTHAISLSAKALAYPTSPSTVQPAT